MDFMDLFFILLQYSSNSYIFHAFFMQKWLKIGCRNLKSRYFKIFLSTLKLLLVSGKWSNQHKIWHGWSLDIVLQNWHVNFLNFWFFAIFWGGSAAQSLKNAVLRDFGKNRNIKISRVNFLCIPTIQGSCMPIFGSIGPFSRD